MLPEFPKMKSIELSDREDVEKITKKYPPYSDFNFVSMWSWDIKGEMRIAQLNGNLVVRFTDYLTGEPFYSFLGDNKPDDTAEKLLELSKKEGIPQKLHLVPENSINRLNLQGFYLLENRDHFDYIYNSFDFYNCKGKKFETQRNMINRFKKKYPNVIVKKISLSLVKNDILKLNEKWKIKKIINDNEGKIPEELKNESKSITRIFSFNVDNIFAVCVFNKEELIAYVIDEILEGDFILCHFAKANVDFSGVYSFLMHENCKILTSFDKKFINYEQDLGLPNLRFSKTSFIPVNFLKKFSIIKN